MLELAYYNKHRIFNNIYMTGVNFPWMDKSYIFHRTVQSYFNIYGREYTIFEFERFFFVRLLLELIIFLNVYSLE